MAKVVFCTPVVNRPYDCWIESLEASVPAIEAAGWEHGLAQVVNRPYISSARSDLLHKALDDGADVVVFIDYDLGWQPQTLVKLLETEGNVICGTYRFREEQEGYMGRIQVDANGVPITRADGCVKMHVAPAGFLKVTRKAVQEFARKYPELLYGDPLKPHVDLFNHGARDGVWWGEDYAFTDRWVQAGGEVWCVPDLDLEHRGFPGNFHQYLLKLSRGECAD